MGGDEEIAAQVGREGGDAVAIVNGCRGEVNCRARRVLRIVRGGSEPSECREGKVGDLCGRGGWCQ